MNRKYKLTATLEIKGPFISSSGTDAVRGIDRIFALDRTGHPVLNGSHIKGKLLEALKELQSTKHSALGVARNFDVLLYFGDKGNRRGLLRFGDFKLVSSKQPEKESLTRITIESKTGTVKEKNLQGIENLIAPGSVSEWQGEIAFFAENEAEKEKIARSLTLGFKWMAGLGGIKGSGFGNLESVSLSAKEAKRQHQSSLPHFDRLQSIALAFEFDDDLFIGEIARGTNFKESQRIIPGATIKGAFAHHLNTICNEKDLAKAIDKQNALVAKEFPALAQHFSAIHFTHAFPAPPNASTRPVVVPFSTVQLPENDFDDVALSDGPTLTPQGKAPAFQVDWKDPHVLDSDFGWGRCEPVNKTRTAIDPQTRTAAENKLYTFQYISPFEANHSGSGTAKKLRWLAEIRLPVKFFDDKSGYYLDEAKKQALANDFKRALNSHWRYLGKRDARFKLAISQGPFPRSQTKHKSGENVDGRAVITLQTDALMFDGRQLAGQGEINLKQVYAQYWQDATDGACKLTDFFARQKMLGGYLAIRYPTGDSYYPYILTEAGSVFTLEINDPNKAVDCLQCLEWDGLPLPQEILQAIPKQEEAWRHCPFVPENGFGEIAINLNWHWQKQYPAMKGDKK